MKTGLILLMFLSLYAKYSYAQNSDSLQITQAMQQQIVAWNNGNIEGFMQTYWDNDSLLFIGKNGPSYGWKATLERYKQSYADPAAMGKLTFDLLQLKPLSYEYYFVVGKWRLQRSIGNIEGYFTLMFKKINGKWLIIADHSS